MSLPESILNFRVGSVVDMGLIAATLFAHTVSDAQRFGPPTPEAHGDEILILQPQEWRGISLE